MFAPSAGEGVFSRYSNITPDKAAATSVDYRDDTLAQIPSVIEKYPFGAGLAVAGAGKNFGGPSTATIDGHAASAESQYNYVALELGLPGLLFWIALSVTMISLAVRGLRRIGDVELRLCLAAVFAAIVAFTIMGFVGPTMSNLPFGPYFWFALGIAAYWFAGGLATRAAGWIARGDGVNGPSPAAPALSVSVCICTRNRVEELLNCLESISAIESASRAGGRLRRWRRRHRRPDRGAGSRPHLQTRATGWSGG